MTSSVAVTSSAEIEELVNRIKPLLAGRGPDEQGGTLACLMALFLAGFVPPMRETLLALHIDTVRQLIPIFEYELFGQDGHPGERQ